MAVRLELRPGAVARVAKKRSTPYTRFVHEYSPCGRADKVHKTRGLRAY